MRQGQRVKGLLGHFFKEDNNVMLWKKNSK